jgi:hypothetical protein
MLLPLFPELGFEIRERMKGKDKVLMLRFGFLRLMGSRWAIYT